jgi:hypothetical protein
MNPKLLTGMIAIACVAATAGLVSSDLRTKERMFFVAIMIPAFFMSSRAARGAALAMIGQDWEQRVDNPV